MSTKFKRSWEIFKASVAVTFRHRKLLWFPLLISLLTLVIALFFASAIAVPVVLHPTGHHLNEKAHWVALKDYYFPAPVRPEPGDRPRSDSENPTVVGHVQTGFVSHGTYNRSSVWWYPVFLALYLLSMFLATFFNVAFYSEIMAALDGRGVSFRRGLRTAQSRLPSILAWSLLAGLVGWLIRMIEERLPFVGRIVMGLVGMAWSVAAVFVIPVIIQMEPTCNPVKVLQQSAMTLKRTWGEGLIGYLGFSAGSLVIFIGSLIPLAAGLVAAVLLRTWVIALVVGVLWLAGLFLAAYICGVANHVYRCALYKYATEGTIPEPFNQELMDMAWKVKKSHE